jgi:hypothetical protein
MPVVTMVVARTLPAAAPMSVVTTVAGEGGQGIGQQQAGEQSGNEFLHDDYLREEKTPVSPKR